MVIEGRLVRENGANVSPPHEACDPAVRVFVIFDHEHDRDLFDKLLTQSRLRTSGFRVVGASEPRIISAVGLERMQEQIRAADQVIVICGERTDESEFVSFELDIAQQERVPYLLLWGRREPMCKKPSGATEADGMYSWTPEIIRQQQAFLAREALREPSPAADEGIPHCVPGSGGRDPPDPARRSEPETSRTTGPCA